MTTELRLREIAEELEYLEERLETIKDEPWGQEHMDLQDQIQIQLALRDFYLGGGMTITLRIKPMPWEDVDVRTWDWQELLDSEAVEVVRNA